MVEWWEDEGGKEKGRDGKGRERKGKIPLHCPVYVCARIKNPMA